MIRHASMLSEQQPQNSNLRTAASKQYKDAMIRLHSYDKQLDSQYWPQCGMLCSGEILLARKSVLDTPHNYNFNRK